MDSLKNLLNDLVTEELRDMVRNGFASTMTLLMSAPNKTEEEKTTMARRVLEESYDSLTFLGLLEATDKKAFVDNRMEVFTTHMKLREETMMDAIKISGEIH